MNADQKSKKSFCVFNDKTIAKKKMKAKKNRRSARGVFFCMERKKKRPHKKNIDKNRKWY